MEEKQEMTGYPSIDKPWLKYYSQETINAKLPECTLYEYLWENNKDHLEDIALNYFGRKMTYGELFENIDLVARAFAAQGVKAEDVVTIASLSCIPSVLCFYALNQIGAIVNYTNFLAAGNELSKYFAIAQPEFLVTLDLFAEKTCNAAVDAGVKKIVIYSLAEWMPEPVREFIGLKINTGNTKINSGGDTVCWKDFLRSADLIQQVTMRDKNPNSVALLAHTGGTTGFPKCVQLSDKAINAVAFQYDLCMRHERREVFLNIMVPRPVYGISVCLHMPLCLGLEVVLIPKFEAAGWSEYIRKYQPAHVAGIPYYFSPMLEDSELEKMDLSCLKTLAVGGDGLNESLERKLNDFLKKHNAMIEITKGYGMSEVGATAITTYEGINKISSVGIPMVKNTVKIYDIEKDTECTYGEEGEICLCCESMMIGYKDNQMENDNLIRVHKDGRRWVHTGDLGFMDEDGFLFLVGRMKRIIFLGPKGLQCKAFPKMIEEVIGKAEEVKECCVVSRENPERVEAKAYVVLHKEYKGTEKCVEEKIYKICEGELTDYMRPSSYEFLDALPLTAAGKVDYKALEER